MKTFSINRRLTAGLAAIILFFLAQATAVLTMGRQTEREVVEVARRNTVAQVNLAELSTLAQQIRRYEKEYFIYVSVPERRAQYQKEWTGTMDKITTLLGKIRGNSDVAFSGDEVQRVSKWWDAAEFYKSEMNRIFVDVEARAKLVAEETAREATRAAEAAKLPKPKEAAPAMVLTSMYSPVETNGMIAAGKDRFSADLIKGVAETFTAKSQATLELTSVTNEGFNKMIYGVVASVLVGIAIGLYLLFSLPRSVSLPIEQLTKNVDAISRGDTSRSSSAIAAREFQALSASVERMRIAQEVMVQRLRKNG